MEEEEEACRQQRRAARTGKVRREAGGIQFVLSRLLPSSSCLPPALLPFPSPCQKLFENIGEFDRRVGRER